jgi:hypothetical protein
MCEMLDDAAMMGAGSTRIRMLAVGAVRIARSHPAAAIGIAPLIPTWPAGLRGPGCSCNSRNQPAVVPVLAIGRAAAG